MAEPSPRECRDHLVRSLEADLVGPFRLDQGHGAQELLPNAPSHWYLTGFLAPEEARAPEDPTSDEQAEVADPGEGDEPDPGDPDPKQRRFFPASLGLSVLLPKQAESVRVQVSFADYVPEPVEEPREGKRKRQRVWRRVPVVPAELTLPLDNAQLEPGVPVPNTVGIMLQGRVAEVSMPERHAGDTRTRALALFVVNKRAPEEQPGLADSQFIFQVKLALSCEAGIVARPDFTGVDLDEWDAKVNDLQFRDVCEYAVGHNVAVRVPDGEAQRGKVTRVETTWLPRHEVRRVTTFEDVPVITEMAALGALSDPEAIEAALGKLPLSYADWIAHQRQIDVGDGPTGDKRADTQEVLMDQAQQACERIREGIALLKSDAEVRRAFCLANLAMSRQAKQRNPRVYANQEPAWRLFQLAFLLLNLPSLADAQHKRRDDVELIFFPTGGGKTEAYLGVIAFTLLLRRMRGQTRSDRGLGVAVILRYTLRLLTLDQLERATTLICALEQLRKAEPKLLGEERFTIGLWVGKSATDNRLQDAVKKVSEFKNKTGPSPCPLLRCPWCASDLTGEALSFRPSAQAPARLVTSCPNFECDFCGDKSPDGLPLSYVDEQVYRELPSFLLATVDKFAMLPWRAEGGMLFGRVRARKGERFFGPADKAEKGASLLPQGLVPPELIVQDELHLISGPLGTMVGLYETAIEQLATQQRADGVVVRPKIIASTATVRRARDQIAALYGRKKSQTRLFPPPGVDDNQTFFARLDEQSPGRLYLGVSAPGRAMKAILLRVYVNLLTSAEHLFDRAGSPQQHADHYMTVAGYFNALRELGGMRRLVEDEARHRAKHAEDRRPIDHVGPHPFWKTRTLAMEPLELTSRETTSNISAQKELLKTPYLLQQRRRADVLLASNMISVGVDIERLGVMVVAGQPKTTAEYIQATSRVGRPGHAAGLVVTCFNVAKARDRSHYERFNVYHQSFYRHVEASSVTPFSLPALDRGLAGVLVTMTRFAHEALTPPLGASELKDFRKLASEQVQALAARATRTQGDGDEVLGEGVRARAEKLLDDWEALVRGGNEGGWQRAYSDLEKIEGSSVKYLLHSALDKVVAYNEEEARFVAPRSMREVEATVHLWIPKDGKGDTD